MLHLLCTMRLCHDVKHSIDQICSHFEMVYSFQGFLILTSRIKLKALYIRHRLILCVARRAVQGWMSFYRFLPMNFSCLSEYLPLFFTGLAEIVNGLLNDKLPEQKLQECNIHMYDQRIAPI